MNKIKRTFRLASASSGTGLTIFFGLLSVAITLYHNEIIPKCVLIPLIFLLIPVSILITSEISIATISPKLYAKLTISGESLEHVLTKVAHYSKDLHQDFEAISKGSAHILSEVNDKMRESLERNIPSDQLETNLKSIWKKLSASSIFKEEASKIDDFLISYNKRFNQTEKLIIEASKELKIPEQRFRNHVIQSTPELFKNRVEKYSANLKELCSHIDQNYTNQEGVNAGNLFQRVYGLVRQNVKIQKICNQRVRRAQDIIEFKDLHQYVASIASCNSTTASLGIYAQALSNLAEENKEKLERWEGNINAKVYQDMARKFQFIFRKQKAYPGFDPHQILLKLYEHHIKNLEKVKGFNTDTYNVKLNIIKVLSSFKNFYRNESYKDDCFFIEKEAYDKIVKGKNKEGFLLDKIQGIINSLSSIDVHTKNLTTSYKSDLVYKFKTNILPEFFNNTNGRRYIVTHGYSKSIRQIIKHGLDENEKSNNYVFILEGEQSSSFESILMRFELQNEISNTNQRFGNISIGDFDTLKELIDIENDKVMILIGAECFDKDNKIIIARGLNQLYDDIVEHFKDKTNTFKSFIAAEAYKGEIESISNTEPFDDHFDRVDIVNGSKFNYLVTDKEVIEFKKV